jgi:hypothetical protein
MKYTLLITLIFFHNSVKAQPELSLGYATNRKLANGIPIHFAYDFKIKNRIL